MEGPPQWAVPDERVEMRYFPVLAAIGAGALTVMASAFAPAYSQTRPASPPSASPSGAAAGQGAPTKREACKVDAKSLRGASQDRVDQYQLCMAQARTDCLKDAIARKIVGAERKEFVKTCIGPREDDNM